MSSERQVSTTDLLFDKVVELEKMLDIAKEVYNAFGHIFMMKQQGKEAPEMFHQNFSRMMQLFGNMLNGAGITADSTWEERIEEFRKEVFGRIEIVQ